MTGWSAVAGCGAVTGVGCGAVTGVVRGMSLPDSCKIENVVKVGYFYRE